MSSQQINTAAQNDYEVERAKKQMYLYEHIVQAGYEPVEFASFVNEKINDGTNVDNWSWEGLVQVVEEFRQQYVSIEVQQPKQAFKPIKLPIDEDFIDVDDSNFSKYTSTQFEDCPQVILRDFIETKSANHQTELNQKKVTIKIPSYEIKKGSWFTPDYSVFNIDTEIQDKKEKIRTQRKDSDFYTLRRLLKVVYPNVLIPPLPNQSNKKIMKLVEKQLLKRLRFFQRFLQAVGRSEVLKSSQFLFDFLSLQDQKLWEASVKKQEKIKAPKDISELTTLDGKASVEILQTTILFCNKMKFYVDSQATQYEEAVEISKEINQKCKSLNSSIQSLSKCFERISDLSSIVKLERNTQLFDQLSKILSGTGENIINTGELIKLYCGSHMKYHLSEQDSLKELLATRDLVSEKYQKQERALYQKKEKLFVGKNPSKWGFTQGPLEELVGRSDELFQNKAKAFKFMLSQETQQLNELREELSFYTNQCWDEIRRVGTDNGILLTDHFITQSQLQCTYINQFHILWADFISHFAEGAHFQDKSETIEQPEIANSEPQIESIILSDIPQIETQSQLIKTEYPQYIEYPQYEEIQGKLQAAVYQHFKDNNQSEQRVDQLIGEEVQNQDCIEASQEDFEASQEVVQLDQVIEESN